jgi:uncharacterized protein (DUF1800 family)
MVANFPRQICRFAITLMVAALGIRADAQTMHHVEKTSASSASPQTRTAIEYYNTNLNHYFITAEPSEQASVESGGAGPGWKKTGDSFMVFAASAPPGDANLVCRFYGSVSPGPNSHFYTASAEECNQLKQLQASTPANKPRWNFEGMAFAAYLPASSQCPANAPLPVYRAYNNRAAQIDSNHRQTTRYNEYQALLSKGWIGEGVAMCASPANLAAAPASPPVIYINAQKDAARFLTQATFGPTSMQQIADVQSMGYESWLNQQFAMQASSHVQYIKDRLAAGDRDKDERSYEAVWQQWLYEPGQLRARVAFALSEIFVISNIAPDLNAYAMSSYMDLLNRNAFGNYRQFLEEVTLHPAMGYYLNMIGSKKANPAKGTHPNENYAREVMQLFSIGLYKLNVDGSRQTGADGNPISTYDQAAVEGVAAAFTGWNFAGNDTTNAAIFNPAKENWLDPMVAWPAWHETAAKTLFDGITLPAGQTPQKDMKDALDAIANHANVGPFIVRELIQRLVTSNPTPAYISRVAAIFNNNGLGVRGDLKAVVRAILLDAEARDLTKLADPKYGKQREPVIRFANFLRAFNARSTSGLNRIWYLDSSDASLGQSPLLAPSVFNFFSPNYRQPGALAQAGLVAPEFQITTETSMVGQLNFFSQLIKNGGYGSDITKLTFDFTALTAMAGDPAKLVDTLNLLLLNGNMSENLRNILINALAALPAPKTGTGSSVTDRVKAALIMISLSPEFAIQK